MGSQQPAQDAEILLGQWLQENDPSKARELMEALIAGHAEPLIRRIVGFKLESSRDHQDRRDVRPDVEDVCHTALHNLLSRLQRVKSGDHEPSDANFSGYAAVVAYNACNEYFREKRPAWARLAMRLRYLATHSPELSLWQMEKGQQLCGFARDRGREASRDLTRLGEAHRGLRRNKNSAGPDLALLVDSILDAAGGPLPLEDLVDVVAEWSGEGRAKLESLDQNRGGDAPRWELADTKAPPETDLQVRQYMKRLWNEICDLPLDHRRALLLNLEDSAGGDIQLFEFLGIATIRQIAVTLEIDPLAFAELWNRLPIDDATIGRELGLSRQDVANRRSSARKRLARRMRSLS